MANEMKLSLRAARVNAKMTQIQAAESLGVTAQTLRNWETGRNCPSLENAQRLCDLYQVEINSIFIPKKANVI